MAADQGTLYGSLTSPYVRFCRIVRRRAAVDGVFRFEVVGPFDDGIRKLNPLGKVPALIMDDGTALLETTLIVRTLNAYGPKDLFPADPRACLAVEADIALAMGVLDLGVAYFLESRRSDGEVSAHWQERRSVGLSAALPALNTAAERALKAPESLSAVALAVTADWLGFRLSDVIDWRGKASALFKLADALLEEDDIAATDPRLA
ncbi:MAG: glutathione S-transferase N-terminal domain-containing protein [Pseudomonadota bacterium]